jgi:hypothetical protein
MNCELDPGALTGYPQKFRLWRAGAVPQNPLRARQYVHRFAEGGRYGCSLSGLIWQIVAGGRNAEEGRLLRSGSGQAMIRLAHRFAGSGRYGPPHSGPMRQIAAEGQLRRPHVASGREAGPDRRRGPPGSGLRLGLRLDPSRSSFCRRWPLWHLAWRPDVPNPANAAIRIRPALAGAQSGDSGEQERST